MRLSDRIRYIKGYLSDPDASSIEKLVMVSLVLHANKERIAVIRAKDIANDCSLALVTVFRTLGKLKDRGWIDALHTGRNIGTYRVLDPETAVAREALAS